MAQSKVSPEHFLVVQGWMITELRLKGNELLVYACIYGFSQAENQVFNGSLQYLADWTNSTKQSVIKCLKSLVDKSLIEKNETMLNGIKFCEYRATELNRVLNKVEWGVKQSLTGGSKQSLPNNISNKNIEENIEDIYADNPELNQAIKSFIEFRKSIKKPMTDYAVKLLIQNLNGMTSSVPEQIEIINQSIVNGWQGVFPIKEQKQGKQQFNFNSPSYNNSLKADMEWLKRFDEKENGSPKTAADDEGIRQRAEELKKMFE